MPRRARRNQSTLEHIGNNNARDDVSMLNVLQEGEFAKTVVFDAVANKVVFIQLEQYGRLCLPAGCLVNEWVSAPFRVLKVMVRLDNRPHISYTVHG